MNEKLKPCPFCGGEAEIVWEINGTATVECIGCGALVDGIKQWNSRANEPLDCVECYECQNGAPMVPYRTCKPIWIEDGLACDKCGYWWPLKHYDNGKPCYCPNCGAKVVNE